MEANQILDQTLPTELQGVVRYEQAQASQQKTAVTEGEPMPENTITIDQVKAVASEVAAGLLKQANAEAAVADKIAGLTTEVNTAKAELATATNKATDATAQLNAKTSELATANESLKTATTKATELTQANATLTKQLNTLVSEKAVANRTAKLKEFGVAEAVANHYVALNESGTLKVDDVSFEASCATLKAVFEAGKASAKPAEGGGAAANAAAGTAAGTPAAATATAATGAANEQPAQAAATTTGVPAAPDLSNVQNYTAAVANFLQGGMTPSESGRAAYAKAF